MAFVCTVAGAECHADVFRSGDSYAVMVPVGFDDVRDLNYFVMVGLDSIPPGDLEYYFCIVEVDGETKDERRIWSGLDLPGYISPDDRDKIRNTILIITEGLLNTVRPERVFRCTRDADMPDQALEKHYAVSHIFKSCGYRVATADIYHGKRVWWMEREVDEDRCSRLA